MWCLSLSSKVPQNPPHSCCLKLQLDLRKIEDQERQTHAHTAGYPSSFSCYSLTVAVWGLMQYVTLHGGQTDKHTCYHLYCIYSNIIKICDTRLMKYSTKPWNVWIVFPFFHSENVPVCLLWVSRLFFEVVMWLTAFFLTWGSVTNEFNLRLICGCTEQLPLYPCVAGSAWS